MTAADVRQQAAAVIYYKLTGFDLDEASAGAREANRAFEFVDALIAAGLIRETDNTGNDAERGQSTGWSGLEFEEWTNDLAENMGNSWDGDEGQEALIESFMKHYGKLDQLLDGRDLDKEYPVTITLDAMGNWSVARSSGVADTPKDEYERGFTAGCRWSDEVSHDESEMRIRNALDYCADTTTGDWQISYHEAVQRLRQILRGES